MIICDICTGRHVTSACVIARAHIEACYSANEPDDFVREPAKIIPFPKVMHVEHEIGRAVRRSHRIQRANQGIQVTRLA